MAWDTVIGLEVHVQLKTQAKLFSGSATTFGAKPNSQTAFIDAGFPGVLPVLNAQAVNMAIQFGLAIKATINQASYFERKNYFYPDLPKGYQISQFQLPIVANGFLSIVAEQTDKEKKIAIVRAHLEEDAGKSLHAIVPGYTGIDLNRAGMPLLEIVTAPCLSSADEAISYLKTLHQLVCFLGICDGNMQEGSFRCDVNISLKPKGATQLGVRTELKNLNSFRFIEKAIAVEQARHQESLSQGIALKQETRLFCPETETTHILRSKENEQDYRYFPDPDLLPIHISQAEIDAIVLNLPDLPQQIKQNLANNTLLSEEDIHFLLKDPSHYQFFEQVKQTGSIDEKTLVNWLKGPYTTLLYEQNASFTNPPITPETVGILLNHVQEKTITHSQARDIFIQHAKTQLSIDSLLTQVKNDQIDDSELNAAIETLMVEYPQQVQDYQAGKTKLLGFFVGQLMKQTKKRGNPEQISRLIMNYFKKLD